MFCLKVAHIYYYAIITAWLLKLDYINYLKWDKKCAVQPTPRTNTLLKRKQASRTTLSPKISTPSPRYLTSPIPMLSRERKCLNPTRSKTEISRGAKPTLPILSPTQEWSIKASGRMDSLTGLANFSSTMDPISMALSPMDSCTEKEGLFQIPGLTMKVMLDITWLRGQESMSTMSRITNTMGNGRTIFLMEKGSKNGETQQHTKDNLSMGQSMGTDS